jgi:L-alanine-DL-glutamate epimerase-like enolase superfamily enzyme
MQISKITTSIENIPLKTPFCTALRRVDAVMFVRVKLTCRNGLFAYGEAPATKAVTGEDLESISSSIEVVKEELYAKELFAALKILHVKSIGSSAKAALDMAILSLLAQKNKQTLLQYLGAKDFSPIQTDITISLNDADTMLEDAKDAYENGFDILKVKLGSDIHHAVAVTKLLSQKLPKAKLLIDANQAWNLKKSLYYINAVKNLHVELIEQPVIAQDLESLKIISQSTDIPILADEAVFTLEDVKKVYENSCADMINIKLMKCGGVSKAQEILEYAREKNIVCMLGSMLEGPVSIAVAYALCFAYRDVVKYVDLDSPLLYKELPSFVGGFAIKRNQIKPIKPASIEANKIPIFD